MADRSSAGIFGDIFNYLAGTKAITREKMIDMLWTEAWKYDFTYDQMDADDALVKLGLAKICGCGGIYYKGRTPDSHTEETCNAQEF